MKKKRYNSGSPGFTLLFAALVGSLVLAIGLAILSISVKQLNLSIAGRESQQAFYSADAGTECALYFEQGAGIDNCDFGVYSVEGGTETPCGTPEEYAAFRCLDQIISLETSGAVGNAVESHLTVTEGPDDLCFYVDIVKKPDSFGVPSTIIESRGYNKCGEQGGRYERAMRSISY